MCHVKSSYAFRTVKLLFILGARSTKRREKRRTKEEKERESEEQTGKTGGPTVTIWPPRIHYGQNYQVITTLVAKTAIYKCKRMRECFWFNDAPLSLPLRFSRSRRGRANFVIVESEDSSTAKDVLALEIRRWLFSMLTSFLLKIRSPVKIE